MVTTRKDRFGAGGPESLRTNNYFRSGQEGSELLTCSSSSLKVYFQIVFLGWFNVKEVAKKGTETEDVGEQSPQNGKRNRVRGARAGAELGSDGAERCYREPVCIPSRQAAAGTSRVGPDRGAVWCRRGEPGLCSGLSARRTPGWREVGDQGPLVRQHPCVEAQPAGPLCLPH